MKRWKIPKPDKELAKSLSEELEINDFLVLLLTVRGYDTSEKIRNFLFTDDNEPIDPYSLKDMDKAVKRIRQALDTFETIGIFGDYDVDGITSTTLVYSYLEACGANVMFYIPEREGEGYGLNIKAIETLHERGVSLLITVDNGISAFDEVEYANELGLDVVITDHHQPSEHLPNACAVVDPHRADCESKYKDFAGVGVAYKLICALDDSETTDTILENYLELAAMGTIADIVPLTGENRWIVQKGLQHMAHSDRPGLRALVDEAGLDIQSMTASGVAFGLAPRMNACGRMGSPLCSVKLLLSDDEEEAHILALELSEENRRRQATEKDILEKLNGFFMEHPECIYDRVLVVDGEDMHQGVIGIVASHLVGRYGKPVIVITHNGDIAKGSGRSLPGFSLYKAFSACSDLFIGFGGHELAAGLTIKTSAIPELRRRINEYASQHDTPIPQLDIDLKLNPRGLSASLAAQLLQLEPFGCENKVPLFALMGMTLTNIFPVGGGKHLRLTVSRDEYSVTVMRFRTSVEEFPYKIGDLLDLAVTLEATSYRGQEQLSVYAHDIRFSGVDIEPYIHDMTLYEAFRRGESLSKDEAERLMPSRPDYAAIYRLLKANDGWKYDSYTMCCRLRSYNIGYGCLLTALDIMEENGLITRINDGNTQKILLVPTEQKVNLQSGTYYESLIKGHL